MMHFYAAVLATEGWSDGSPLTDTLLKRWGTSNQLPSPLFCLLIKRTIRHTIHKLSTALATHRVNYFSRKCPINHFKNPAPDGFGTSGLHIPSSFR